MSAYTRLSSLRSSASSPMLCAALRSKKGTKSTANTVEGDAVRGRSFHTSPIQDARAAALAGDAMARCHMPPRRTSKGRCRWSSPASTLPVAPRGDRWTFGDAPAEWLLDCRTSAVRKLPCRDMALPRGDSAGWSAARTSAEPLPLP